MRKDICSALVVLMCISLSLNTGAQDIAPKVKTILFLGNSITWMGNYANDVEAWITVHYPNRHFDFINAGVPSETVSGLSEEGHAGGQFPRPDLHERLQRVLNQIKPDLVFACYGMNDGIYKPFDTERFQKFKDGIYWLHNEVVKTGARLIHLTPPVYDGKITGNAYYDGVLDRYTDWLISLRTSAKWEVIDVHYPMKKYLQAHREIDAKYHLDGFALAEDGVHPYEIGHWIIAKQILVHLGCKGAAECPSIARDMATVPNGLQILKLVTERGNMMRDAWLRSTKHKRPGLPEGLPLDEALERAAELSREINALLHDKKIAEVYLLAGDANAAGTGEIKALADTMKINGDVMIFANTLSIKEAPTYHWTTLQQVYGNTSMFGPELGFASKIKAVIPNAQVAIIKHTGAGSNLYKDWNPGADKQDLVHWGAQFKLFIKTVNDAINSLRARGYEPVIKGMIWQQGEGDAVADSSSTQYGANLHRFIARVHAQIRSTLFPFVYGYAYPQPVNAQTRAITQAERDVDQDAGTALSIKRAYVVQTSDIVSTKMQGNSAGEYYFDTRSTWLLGARMAEKMNAVNGK